jgi:PAS domain S-box-containing protein
MLTNPRYGFLLATVLPLCALALTWVLRAHLQPFLFIFFYPASFFTAALAGVYPGILATALSVSGVAWLHATGNPVAPADTEGTLLALTVFGAMGIAFSAINQLWARALVIVRSVLESHDSPHSVQQIVGDRDLPERLSAIVRDRAKMHQELMRVTQELEAQRHHLQSILDHVPAFVAYWDSDLRLRFANQQFMTWFGIDVTVSIGKRMPELFGEQRFALVSPYFQQALEGKSQRFHAPPIAWDGQSRELLVHLEPDVVDANIMGVYVLSTDITELQRAHGALGETSAMLAAFADNVPALAAYVDPQERFVYANRLFEEWFEVPRSRLEGRTVRELFGDEAYAVSRPHIARALRGERVQFQRTLLVKGQPVELDVSFLPRIDGAGNTLGYFALYVDITEQQRAKRALEMQNAHLEDIVRERTIELERREHELRSILDNLPAMVAHWDANGCNLLANNAFVDWLGITPEQMRGRHISAIGEHEYEQRKPHVDAVLSGIPQRFEVDTLSPDGTVTRTGLATYIPDVRNGKVVGYFGLVDDITELRRTQQALEAARDVAVRATRAKADFLANMSHEIRTPMNAVLGFAYLLEKSELSREGRELVRKITNSGRILLGIINDILDFSKIESGRLELEDIPFRLSAVLEDLSGMMASAAAGKDIELIVDSSSAAVEHLRGDPLRLGQVLLNLTSNAIKFTDRGYVRVKTTLVHLAGDSAQLRFDVEDTGVGIAPDKLSDIFAPFSQAEASTTRRFGGTGLGLTITRRIVELMGGEISVVSTPGRGSTFSLQVTIERAVPQPHTTSDTTHHDVLIAAHHPIALGVLGEAVHKLGWTPQLAPSAEEALATLDDRVDRGHAFDVVLLDQDTRPMDGLTAAGHVRKRLAGRRMPCVIVMVRARDRGEIESLPGFGSVDALLTKPVTASALYQAVSATRQKRMETAAPASTATESGRRLQHVRVLVVDDNELNREVVEEVLSSEGAQVSLADDGRVALDWLLRHRDAVDVVLMDVQMPVMDGYEATRRIRQELGLTSLPVYALTAGAWREDQEAALAAGMNGHFAKPFDVEVLVETLRQVAAVD